MKKFIWRLQRLLDIKIKQEEVKRAELVSITQKAVSVRGMIIMQRTILQQKLNEVGQADAKERIAEQRLFLKHVHVIDKRIARLEEKLVEIEKLRQEKIKEVMELRKFRKGLEKIKENDKVEFIKEQEKYEQKDSDDKTNDRYARKIIQNAC